MNWLLVFIGGGIGSVCRYGISQIASSLGWRFAISTLVSNVVATVILALVWIWLMKKQSDPTVLWSLIAVGFCGGLSTFSTFSLETVQLFRDGYVTYALTIVAANLLICFGCVALMAKLSI